MILGTMVCDETPVFTVAIDRDKKFGPMVEVMAYYQGKRSLKGKGRGKVSTFDYWSQDIIEAIMLGGLLAGHKRVLVRVEYNGVECYKLKGEALAYYKGVEL